ncbi:MAG TPA: hypothetical protein VF681_09060 [Abditibacteriaceae bacterium]|jgi:type IV secretory pathway VirB10-like protein
MESSASPIGAFLGFWMFVKLVSVLGVAVSVIYALYCLTRIASQLERLANSVEQRNSAQNAVPQASPQTPFYAAQPSVAPPVPFASPPPPVQPPVVPTPPVPPPVAPAPPATPPPPRTTFPTAPSARTDNEPRESANPEETRRNGE